MIVRLKRQFDLNFKGKSWAQLAAAIELEGQEQGEVFWGGIQ
jgi:hypothetical protein